MTCLGKTRGCPSRLHRWIMWSSTRKRRLLTALVSPPAAEMSAGIVADPQPITNVYDDVHISEQAKVTFKLKESLSKLKESLSKLMIPPSLKNLFRQQSPKHSSIPDAHAPDVRTASTCRSLPFTIARSKRALCSSATRLLTIC